MTVYHKAQEVVSTKRKPVFHDVTELVKSAVVESGIKNGIAVVYSQHTTCSVTIQEESHDQTFDGTKFLLQDLLDVMENLAPKCQREGQYLHPGPAHISHACGKLNEKAEWSLNTEAHLRSCLMGRSESIPVIGGKLELGEFGQVYFIDFDMVRSRKRTVHVQIVGE